MLHYYYMSLTSFVLGVMYKDVVIICNDRDQHLLASNVVDIWFQLLVSVVLMTQNNTKERSIFGRKPYYTLSAKVQ